MVGGAVSRRSIDDTSHKRKEAAERITESTLANYAALIRKALITGWNRWRIIDYRKRLLSIRTRARLLAALARL